MSAPSPKKPAKKAPARKKAPAKKPAVETIEETKEKSSLDVNVIAVDPSDVVANTIMTMASPIEGAVIIGPIKIHGNTIIVDPDADTNEAADHFIAALKANGWIKEGNDADAQ